MVFVMTLWTFPLILVVNYDFAVISTAVTIVAFCVKLGVLYIVVNEFKSLFDITSYGSVKEDYKLFLDSLTL